MDSHQAVRRRFFLAASAAGAGMLSGGLVPNIAFAAEREKEDEEIEVSATEDLMREHGILRRALLIYRQTAMKLRDNARDINPKVLHQTAILFRRFGEDYHEKALEEAYVFPAIRRAGGAAASYSDILEAQHKRGREVTDYILSVTGKDAIGINDAGSLARALENMERMYANHAAREDTVVFPAWKKAIGEKQIKELGETFEEIERREFGEGGFDDAVKQIAGIEQELGYADLNQFTAPLPKI